MINIETLKSALEHDEYVKCVSDVQGPFSMNLTQTLIFIEAQT